MMLYRADSINYLIADLHPYLKRLGIDMLIAFKDKKVRYKYTGYDKSSDLAIFDHARMNGLTMYATGMDMISGDRSICFDMPK